MVTNAECVTKACVGQRRPIGTFKNYLLRVTTTSIVVTVLRLSSVYIQEHGPIITHYSFIHIASVVHI
jgi:hypothetical protein